MNRLLVMLIALAAIGDSPPAAVQEAPSDEPSAGPLDMLPATRAQASQDFRRTPGGRARNRWKRARQGPR